jgi:hypothetical protein
MIKIFILRNDNPEELERQYLSWLESSEKIIVKTHYTCNPYKLKGKIMFSYSIMAEYTKKGFEA